MAVRPPSSDLEADAAGDPNAGKESRDFQRLAEIEEAKHTVKMAIHASLAWLVPISIGLAFLLFWIGVLIYAIQLFTPWGWLVEDQVHELRTVLFSGVLGAIVSQGVKRYLD